MCRNHSSVKMTDIIRNKPVSAQSLLTNVLKNLTKKPKKNKKKTMWLFSLLKYKRAKTMTYVP